MGFNTTCFIRKNNEVLRKSLFRMGYYEINVSEKDDIYKSLRTGTDTMGRICRYMQWNSEESKYCVDCGTNEELFLAIAALRDDSDIYQWFTEGEKWVRSDIHNLIKYKEYFENTGFDYDKTHKASVEELVEYFNNK